MRNKRKVGWSEWKPLRLLWLLEQLWCWKTLQITKVKLEKCEDELAVQTSRSELSAASLANWPLVTACSTSSCVFCVSNWYHPFIGEMLIIWSDSDLMRFTAPCVHLCFYLISIFIMWFGSGIKCYVALYTLNLAGWLGCTNIRSKLIIWPLLWVL